ncbi:hypothetical protein DR64_107 [Paraburkholderia xenovorans LB400]|uniref:Uncharacterized protein n=1 Tax=Paraburkholderia xenovorans (strain LB400) TaxID=266265 RepID=Q13ZC7_PARXL|nr:hypothetical protein [Paraburkholderia xenovorans]ABE30562.1 hypothetical protein Bxe_A2407 [Paraburkholderia xenovorans LB400]AIP31319.1 hypothetical protein DR64_107 [Paraburkholderia xenovorans LB400]
MIVNFHTDPVDLDLVCTDLTNDGVVVIETTRPNFKSIAATVMHRMTECVLPLSVEGADHDWHHYLINDDVESFESLITSGRVAQAVVKWQAAGSPFPYTTKV